MKQRLIASIGGMVVSSVVRAQDPAVTDGDKYKVLLDNERVRVLVYSDLPSEKTHEHRHPAFLVYALSPFKRRLTSTDGRVLTRSDRIPHFRGQAACGRTPRARPDS